MRRRRKPVPVKAPVVVVVSPREQRLERALRLARAMLVEHEHADHATVGVIDNVLQGD